MPAPVPETGRRQTQAPTRPRRFHLIGVGLPKTGTTTLAAIFARHRWGHEHAFEPCVDVLHRRLVGNGSDAEVAEAWLARDAEARLECDSASFHHYAAPLLPGMFPDARYVLTVRDPAAQAGSFVNMMVRNAARHGGTMPPWQRRMGALMIGDFDPALYADPEALTRALPSLADRYLDHWAAGIDRVVGALPRDRVLVLETGQLARSLPALAAHAGVPVDTLVPAHENAGPEKQDWLSTLPDLAERVAERCGSSQARMAAWRQG